MRTGLIILIATAVFAADQASKRLIENLVEPNSIISVLSNFNIVLIFNRGVSFGMGSTLPPEYGPYILAILAFGIVAILGVWAFRSDSTMQQAGLAAMIGGAVSNALDRLEDGAVTDFLDFHISARHWPAFNLADVAIVCGVAALMLEGFLSAPKKDAIL